MYGVGSMDGPDNIPSKEICDSNIAGIFVVYNFYLFSQLFCLFSRVIKFLFVQEILHYVLSVTKHVVIKDSANPAYSQN